MGSKLVLQGVTPDSHLVAVKQLLAIPDPTKIVISTAFMNKGGFSQLQELLTPLAGMTRLFVGIRNGITSAQGVSAAIDSGITTYAVDTGTRNVIFHPKIYFARSATAANLILGSANLTIGGLSHNIEASVSMVLDMADPSDADLVADIEAKIDGMIAEYPEHVFVVPDAASVGVLLAGGRLVDESIVSAPKPSGSSGNKDLDPLSKMKLKTVWVTRPKVAPPPAPVVAAAGVPVAPSFGRTLMWQSTPLKRRDLNVPDGANTNKTGSINLDKGLLSEEIDHRHYFRDEVFKDLTWTARAKEIDETYGKFLLVIKGISYGEFDLAVRHSTSTTFETYLQRNAVFRLSWGPIINYVARADLIDRTLSLYRDNNDPTRFELEID